MVNEFDFSHAVKNPFAGKLQGGHKIIVRHGSPESGWDEIIRVTAEEVEAVKNTINGYRKTISNDTRRAV